jgi:hypothetical protein
LRSSWNVSCRLTHVGRISSYSPRRRQGSDAKADFRRAAPAVANRQVEHALIEYKWKQITATRPPRRDVVSRGYETGSRD